jgi:2-iminobutanoate/2-iminopropanoate deaminase
LTVEHIQPENLAPSLGQYSQVTRDPASELIFVAGQVALDEHGGMVGIGDIGAQTTQTFRNIQTALEGVGSSLRDTLKLMTYIVNPDDLPAFRAARTAYFDAIFPDGNYPAHTLVVVAGLSAPEHLIEVEAVAVPSAR